MSVIHDLLFDGGIALSGAITDNDLEQLFEAAIDRCCTEADQRTIYLRDALEALDRYRDHMPEPSEVREHLRGDDLGDWQKVVTVTAYVCVREYLGAQAEKDIDALKAALEEAAGRGFIGVSLRADCAWGWAPHTREDAWQNGTLYRWERLDGDVNVMALAARVPGGAQI